MVRSGDEWLRRVRAGLTTVAHGAAELDALEEAKRRVMGQINAGLRQIAAVLDQHGIQWRTKKDAGNSMVADFSMAAEPSLSTTLRELDDMAASDSVGPYSREIAQDAAAALRHLEQTLRRLADASEAAASSEPDMPSHESTVAEFDAALDAAREVLQS